MISISKGKISFIINGIMLFENMNLVSIEIYTLQILHDAEKPCTRNFILFRRSKKHRNPWHELIMCEYEHVEGRSQISDKI